MADLVRTKPNRPWVLKMTMFLFVLIGGGAWFFFDATVAYPARGWDDASYRLWVYLDAAEDSGRLRMTDLAIADPKAEYESLRERAASQQSLGQLEMARLEWLRALNAVGALDADTVETQLIDDPKTDTATDGPRQRLDELRAEWDGANARNQPKPLASWDISVQWGIALVCFGASLIMILHILRTIRVRYAWEPSEKRLHLPDGATLTPDDLEDVDKRQWHKFIVYLKVKDAHDRLGGKEVKLDLYQHAMLEDWILEMERTAFPDRTEVEPEKETVEAAAESGAEESSPRDAE